MVQQEETDIPPTPFKYAGPSMKPVLRNIALRCCSFLLLTDAPVELPAIMENCCSESLFCCAQHLTMLAPALLNAHVYYADMGGTVRQDIM